MHLSVISGQNIEKEMKVKQIFEEHKEDLRKSNI